MKSPIQLFIALAVLLAAATVTAQVYKWIDKDGKVQYTDTPPPIDVKGAPKKIDTRPAAGVGSAAAPPAAPAAAGKDAAKGKDAPSNKPKTLADLNKESEKRRAGAVEAEKKAADQARVDKGNQERCKEATRYYRDLETGRPFATTDDAGERKLLDDASRAAEMSRAKAAMTESCK